jgi:hypothetical protein
MTDHEAELEKVCQGLEATRWSAGVSVPVNPDGPEAARLLREMAAAGSPLASGVLTVFADDPDEGDSEEVEVTFTRRQIKAWCALVGVDPVTGRALTKGKPHD